MANEFIARKGLKSLGNVLLPTTKKLYLDGGGNTYLHEVSADKLDVVVGGQTILEVAEGGGGASDSVAIQALNKLYLDGGGNTYITEASGDVMKFYAGGTEMWRLTSTYAYTEGHLAIDATKKFYLDGIGDTYLHEVSADKVDLVVGGQTILEVAEGGGGASDYVAIQAANRFYLDGGTHTYISETNNDDIQFFAGGILAFRLTSGGIYPGSQPIYMSPQAKLYFDDGYHTYIHEVSADKLDFVVGGQTILEIAEAGGGASDYVAIQPLNRLYLDGGSDTYLYQYADNNVRLIAGTVDALSIGSNGIVFNEDSQNWDFRVESNDNDKMLYIDGGDNTVGIGVQPSGSINASGSATLHVRETTAVRNVVSRPLIVDLYGTHNPYEGYGPGILFQGSDYSSDVGDPNTRAYAAIDAVMDASNASTGSVADPGFAAGLKFSVNNANYANLGKLTTAMTIKSDGKVGIGTISPSVNLDVYNSAGWGGIDLDGVSGGELRFQKAGTTYLDIYASNAGSTGALIKATEHLAISVNNTTTPLMYFKSDGKVGVGTTSPVGTFATYGSGDQEIRFQSVDNDASIQISSDADETHNSSVLFLSGTSTRGSIVYDHHPTAATQNMQFKTEDNATTVMTLKAENVGIGDEDPQDVLEVRGPSGANKGITISNANAVTALSFARSSTATARIQLTEPGTVGTGDLRFFVSNEDGTPVLAEALRIQSNKNAYFLADVGIGTASSDSPLHLYKSSGDTQLHIQAVTGGDPTIQMTSGNNRSGVFHFNDGSTVARFDYNHGEQRFRFRAHNESVNDMTISETVTYVNGDLGVGITAPESGLHIVKTGFYDQIHIASTNADNTNATAGVVSKNYAGSSVSMWQFGSNSGANTIYYGSADGNQRGITAFYWYVNASPTATSGHTQAMHLNSDGDLTVAGDLTVNGSSYGTTITNASNNRVFTSTGSAINAEANLTFDGSHLALTGSAYFGPGTFRVDNDVTGNSRFGVGSGGNVSTPAIYLLGDTDTGIYWPAANNLGWVTNGGERMRLTATGKLGIGITSPSEGLHIAGDNDHATLQVENNSSSIYGGELQLYNNKSSGYADNDEGGRINFYCDDDGGNQFESTQIISKVTDVSNGSEDSTLNFALMDGGSQVTAMSIAGSKVGIGTTSPATLLHLSGSYTQLRIQGDTRAGIEFLDSDGNTDGKLYGTDGSIGILDAGGHWAIQHSNDSHTAFNVNTGAEKMRLTAAGLLGIGTTSPDYLLELSGQQALFAIGRGGGSDTIWEMSADSVGFYLREKVLNQYKMAVLETGRVGIGGSSALTALHIQGATATEGIYINSGTDEDHNIINMSGITNGGILKWDDSEEAFSINAGLRVTAGNVLIGTSIADVHYTLTPKLQVETNSHTAGLSAFRNTNDAGGAYLFLGSSRGTSVNSDTIVQDDDALGSIMFIAADGSDRASAAASILCNIDGTPGSNDTPGRLTFNTTADGAASPTTRMTILSGGTVGIGTATPSTGAKLEVYEQSTATLRVGVMAGSSKWQAQGTDGNAANPYWSFMNDPDTGMWRPATNSLSFSTAGVERMRILANGNVGIGTTSPDRLLDLEAGEPVLQWTATSTAQRWAMAAADKKFYIRNFEGTYPFCTTYVSGSGIGNNMSVGMGTTTPVTGSLLTVADDAISNVTATPGTQKLVVSADAVTSQTHWQMMIEGQYDAGIIFGEDTAARGKVGYDAGKGLVGIFDNNGSAHWATHYGSDYLVAETSDTERMRILSDGKVGIGITAPLYALHVPSTVGLPQIMINSSIGDGSSGGTMRWGGAGRTYYGGMIENRGGTGGGDLKFYTAGTDYTSSPPTRMVIDSLGKVGIGTSTSPNDRAAVNLGGAYGPFTGDANVGLRLNHTLTGTPNENIEAIRVIPAFVEAGSGTHTSIFGLHVAGMTVTGAGASTSNTANMYIGSPATIGSARNYQLWIQAGDASRTADGDYDNLVIESSGTAGISILTGTGNAGGIMFGDSGDNGRGKLYYDHNADKMHIATGGSIAMTLDSSQNVGIGITNPNSWATLHVQDGQSDFGCTMFLSEGSQYGVNVAGSTAGHTHGFIGNFRYNFATPASSANNYGYAGEGIHMDGQVGLRFYATPNATVDGSFQPAERMTILAESGNVGIGVTSPSEKLHVDGDIMVNNGRGIRGEDSHERINFHTSNGIEIYTSNSERMCILADGKVGIGTTGPGKTLDIVGDFRTTGTAITWNDGVNSQLEISSAGTNACYLKCAAGDELYIAANGTSYGLRVLTSNNVEVNGDLTVSGGVHIGGTGSANELDDYEEGTWTPLIGGWSDSVTKTPAAQNQGTYTKVGNMVTVFANMVWDGSETMNGGIVVRGLPFTSVGDPVGWRSAGSIAGTSGVTVGGTNLYTLGIGGDRGSSVFYIIEKGSASYDHSPTIANAGAIYGICYTYQVAT